MVQYGSSGHRPSASFEAFLLDDELASALAQQRRELFLCKYCSLLPELKNRCENILAGGLCSHPSSSFHIYQSYYKFYFWIWRLYFLSFIITFVILCLLTFLLHWHLSPTSTQGCNDPPTPDLCLRLDHPTSPLAPSDPTAI
jgi:hypothetical protein